MWCSVVLALVQARLLRMFARRLSGPKMSLLVVRLDQTLGDSAMNSPLLRELRLAHPEAEISLVVHPRIYEMVKFCPYVDHIHCYDWGKSLAHSVAKRHWLAMKFCREQLGGRHFDIAIVPRFDEDHHAAFVALFSGATRRIAYTAQVTERKSVLNAGFDLLYTELLSGADVKHEVERNLEFIRHLGSTPVSTELEFWCGKEERAFADHVLSTLQPTVSPPMLVGLGLSGGHSALKRWPTRHYIELAHQIVDANPSRKVCFLLVGGKEDLPLGEQFVQAHPDTINLIGRTTILQMGALLSRADYFIGNDSGAMHVAAAAGSKVVGIFGSSCHHRFSPWGSRARAISLELDCGPCKTGHRIDRCSTCVHPSPKCMDELQPRRVLELVG